MNLHHRKVEDLIKSTSGNVNKQLKDIEVQCNKLNKSTEKTEKDTLKQDLEKLLEQNFKAMLKELSKEMSQQMCSLMESQPKKQEVCASCEEKVEEAHKIKTEDKGNSNMVFDPEAEAMLEELKMITKGK